MVQTARLTVFLQTSGAFTKLVLEHLPMFIGDCESTALGKARRRLLPQRDKHRSAVYVLIEYLQCSMQLSALYGLKKENRPWFLVLIASVFQRIFLMFSAKKHDICGDRNSLLPYNEAV